MDPSDDLSDDELLAQVRDAIERARRAADDARQARMEAAVAIAVLGGRDWSSRAIAREVGCSHMTVSRLARS